MSESVATVDVEAVIRVVNGARFGPTAGNGLVWAAAPLAWQLAGAEPGSEAIRAQVRSTWTAEDGGALHLVLMMPVDVAAGLPPERPLPVEVHRWSPPARHSPGRPGKLLPRRH